MEISSLSITGRELKLPLPSFVRVNVFIPGRGSYYSRYLAGKKKTGDPTAATTMHRDSNAGTPLYTAVELIRWTLQPPSRVYVKKQVFLMLNYS